MRSPDDAPQDDAPEDEAPQDDAAETAPVDAAEEERAAAPAFGVHLERTADTVDEVAALHDRAASWTGLPTLLNDLKWRLRHAPVLPRLVGRKVHRAWAWNAYDQRDPQWYPQGVATAHDAPEVAVVEPGRRVLVATWYSKGTDGVKRGSRLTFVDLDQRRYRHVILVVPSFDEHGNLSMSPLNVHAGGVVWAGGWLHVAATGRGFVSAHVDDLMRVVGPDGAPDEFGVTERGIASFGHRWVLPVRATYRAVADEGHEKLRYSFLGLDPTSQPPALVAGEYASSPDASTRLARFDLDPTTYELVRGADGTSRPVAVDGGGVLRMQGAVQAHGRLHVSTSNGQWGPGTVWTGTPGSLRPHRWALPMGPEDLAWSPPDDHLWTVTEHPHRRWIVSMRRASFD